MTTKSVFWSWANKTISLLLSPSSSPQTAVQWGDRQVQQVEGRFHFRFPEITKENLLQAEALFQQHVWARPVFDGETLVRIDFHGRLAGGGCCFSSEKKDEAQPLMQGGSINGSSSTVAAPTVDQAECASKLQAVVTAQNQLFLARKEPTVSLQASSWGTHAKTQTLESQFTAFLQGSQRALILVAPSGGGKTTFCQAMAHQLSSQHQPRTPLILSLTSIQKPENALLTEYFTAHGFTPAQITHLKTQPLLLFLDGVDERHIKTNLYKGNSLHEWNVKVVYTCRPEYLNQLQGGLDLFSTERESHPQHLVIAPPSPDLKRQYFEACTAFEFARGMKAQGYEALMAHIPDSLATTMLGLRMLGVILPHFQGRNDPRLFRALTRYKLYGDFIRVWMAPLLHDKRLEEGRALNICRAFATAMNERDSYQVLYDPSIDSEIKKAIGSDARYLECIPLVQVSQNQWVFLYPSLRDYFLVEAILVKISSLQGFTKDTFIRDVLAPALNKQHLDADSDLLSLWSETVKKTEGEERGGKSVTPISLLVDLISNYKMNPAFPIAVANALSILKQAGHLFKGSELEGIQASGVDFSSGFFLQTRLSKSVIQRMNWRGAFVSGVSLEGVQLKDLETGIWPVLKHPAAVTGIRFLPGGRMAVQIAPRETYIWDFNTAQPNKRPFSQISPNGFIGILLEGNSATLTDLSAQPPQSKKIPGASEAYFSPDSSLIALVTDQEVSLWDIAQQKKTKSLKLPLGGAQSLTFGPDYLLIGGSADHSILKWSWKTGQPPLPLRGHSDPVTSLALHPGGRHLVSCSTKETLIWDLSQPASAPQPILSGPITLAQFSPSGRYLATSSAQRVSLWDFTTKEILLVFQEHQSPITSLAFSSDENRLLSGAVDGAVRIWNIDFESLRQAQQAFPLLMQTIPGFRGNDLLSLTSTGHLRFWDVETRRVSEVYTGETSLSSRIQASPDGRLALLLPTSAVKGNRRKRNEQERSSFLTPKPTELKLWDKEKQIVIHKRDNPHPFLEAALSPDGQWIVTSHAFTGAAQKPVSEINLFHIEKPDNKKILIEGPFIDLMAFAPDGQTLALADSLGNGIYLWNTKKGQATPILTNHKMKEISHLSFIDPKTLLVAGMPQGNAGSPLILYNTANEQSTPIPVASAGIGPVAISRNAVMLAYRPSALEEFDPGYRQVRLVNLRGSSSSAASASAKGDIILEGNAARITQLAFTPSEEFLVAVDENQEVMAWKFPGGCERVTDPIPYWRSSTRFCAFNVNTQGATLSPLNRLLLES